METGAAGGMGARAAALPGGGMPAGGLFGIAGPAATGPFATMGGYSPTGDQSGSAGGGGAMGKGPLPGGIGLPRGVISSRATASDCRGGACGGEGAGLDPLTCSCSPGGAAEPAGIPSVFFSAASSANGNAQVGGTEAGAGAGGSAAADDGGGAGGVTLPAQSDGTDSVGWERGLSL